ncbi:MAG: hypothetical protein AAFN59_07430 [Pseudomonadota bacterium]
MAEMKVAQGALAPFASISPPARVSKTARRAKPRRRHKGLIFAFLLMVVLPLGVAFWYLTTRAADQFEASVAFTVRREDAVTPAEMLGGFAGLSGASSRDTDILNEYLQSADLVRALDAEFDLHALYSATWRQDPVFGFNPSGTLEDLTQYWQRMMDINYDASTGLIALSIRSFDANSAFGLAEAVLRESRLMINELSAIAQNDLTRLAALDLEEAEDGLANARRALTEFRASEQIVDPAADLQGQMGLISALQEQLADEMIRADLLKSQTRASDPRLLAGQQRIAVIQARIAGERQKIGTGIAAGGSETDYARLVGRHESLTVELEIARESYGAARMALEAARAEARRQTRYIAAFVKPAVPERATGPNTALILGVIAAFLTLGWVLLSLVFYAIRDRR